MVGAMGYICTRSFRSDGKEWGGDEKGGRLKGVCVFAHLLVRCERETRET